MADAVVEIKITKDSWSVTMFEDEEAANEKDSSQTVFSQKFQRDAVSDSFTAKGIGPEIMIMPLYEKFAELSFIDICDEIKNAEDVYEDYE